MVSVNGLTCFPGFWPTIIHKILETDSSIYVKQRTTGKVQFLFFRIFYQQQKNFHFRRRTDHQTIILSSFQIFLIFFLDNFLRSFQIFLIFSQVVRQLVRLLVYTGLLLIITFRFTCDERKKMLDHQKVSKYYEHDCL